VIYPARLRKIPRSFTWIDHRFISDGYIDRLSHSSATLYLFLLCASDEKGLSYYGDKSLMKKLSMNEKLLETSRTELSRTGLIAWQKPIYQVLSLKPLVKNGPEGKESGMSLKDIFKHAMGGADD
jgi:hypothetical protein